MILMRSLKYSIGGFFIGGFFYSFISDLKRELYDDEDFWFKPHLLNFDYYTNYGGLLGSVTGFLVAKGYLKVPCLKF